MVAKQFRKHLKNKKHIVRVLFICWQMGRPDLAFAETKTTTVTTYVVQTQEERDKTRWTLTEWLRIKERMKLMDVWLAMYSDPQKSKFSPELNLAFYKTKSAMRRQVNEQTTESGTGEGHTIRAQLWMTNLFSSQLGIRTLNIDLGFEGGNHTTGTMQNINESSNVNSVQVASSPAGLPSANTTWYSANLRLFGKHIQDSSLVVKYGYMETKNSFHLPQTDTAPDTTKNWDAPFARGSMAGVELQLYLFSSLGVEGTYHSYRAVEATYKDHSLQGQYGEGLVFLEISILRLQGGVYEERWHSRWDSGLTTDTKERGYLGGIKISI